MTPPKIDLANPQSVLLEVFDDDHWIKDKFSEHLSAELSQFSVAFSDSFKRFPDLYAIASDDDEQSAFVIAFIFGVFDDLLVSTKLLVSGKLTASGNIMRQAIEGIAAGILCSSPDKVFLRKEKKDTVEYWRKVKSRDRGVQAHKSILQLELNCEKLGINKEAVKKFKSLQERYNAFSHAGFVGMTSRTNIGSNQDVSPFHIGGHFDEAKLDFYKIEIDSRTSLCEKFPNMIDGLIRRLSRRKPSK